MYIVMYTDYPFRHLSRSGFKRKDWAAVKSCFQDKIRGNLVIPDDMRVDKSVELTRVILRA
jgi:hypothetical protein